MLKATRAYFPTRSTLYREESVKRILGQQNLSQTWHKGLDADHQERGKTYYFANGNDLRVRTFWHNFFVHTEICTLSFVSCPSLYLLVPPWVRGAKQVNFWNKKEAKAKVHKCLFYLSVDFPIVYPGQLRRTWTCCQLSEVVSYYGELGGNQGTEQKREIISPINPIL